MFAVTVKDDFMEFGVWIFHMLISAMLTQWLVTIIAVKLTILLTIFSTTNQVVLQSSLYIRRLRNLQLQSNEMKLD